MRGWDTGVGEKITEGRGMTTMRWVLSSTLLKFCHKTGTLVLYLTTGGRKYGPGSDHYPKPDQYPTHSNDRAQL